MSETQFCRAFLSALDARPVKLSSDHFADPRQYPASSAYILPKLPNPPHPQRPNPKSGATASAGAPDGSSTIQITLKPMKPSSPTVPLSAITASTTSIFDLKTSYSNASSIPTSKIKILYKKKPVIDSKTVAEVIGQDAGGDVEFSVMVLGGAMAGGTPVQSPPTIAPSEAEKGLAGTGVGPAAQGPSGKEVVAGPEFWDDLKGFVLQRVRDEKEGERLYQLFKQAWEKDR